MIRTIGAGSSMSASAAGRAATGSALGSIVSLNWTPTGSLAGERSTPVSASYDAIASHSDWHATQPFAVLIWNASGCDPSTGGSATASTLVGSKPSVSVIVRA